MCFAPQLLQQIWSSPQWCAIICTRAGGTLSSLCAFLHSLDLQIPIDVSTYTSMVALLLCLMWLVLISGVATRWKYLFRYDWYFPNQYSHSAISLSTLIMVHCTCIATWPIAGSYYFPQYIMWLESLIFIRIHFVLSKHQSYSLPTNNV